MSSMVGGALGVALLTAFGRALSQDETAGAIRDAGLTEAEVDQARRALVGSASFQDALAKLPPDLAERVIQVAKTVFTSGVADAFLITGVIALAATVVVFFVWPRERRSSRAGHTA